jgi:nucleoside-diphosphate-sugar epimerase
MRIAVLGATGAAGRAFVPRAEAAGHALLVRRTDIFDRAALASLLDGCDAVVNLATSIPKPGGRGDWAVNDRIRREGTANLLAACEQRGVRILIQQSVAMLHCVADDRPQTEDDPIEGYGALASAADMEALVHAAPLDGRLVRGGLFYGPGTHREATWLAELRDPAFRIPGDGTAWLSSIHVEDYATAVLAVLEHGRPRTAYIACDDEPLRLGELYARIAAGAGITLPPSGGPQRLRSFRTANARLRAIGWRPAHPTIG